MDAKAHPRFQEMVNRAAIAVGSTETASIALGASGVMELLDEIDELREREHFLITHDLKKGDVRSLVRRLTGLTRCYLSPALSEHDRAHVQLELIRILRQSDRALGVDH